MHLLLMRWGIGRGASNVACAVPQPAPRVHNYEGDVNGFTLTPDGEECFGAAVDAAFPHRLPQRGYRGSD